MATQIVSLTSLCHRSSSDESFTGKRARRGERSAGFFPRSQISCVCEPQAEKGYNCCKVELRTMDQATREGGTNTKKGWKQPHATSNKKRLKRKKREEAGNREVPRFFGLWIMSSAISYILRKARAFYNEFCCDSYEDLTYMGGDERMLVHPYFSIPVVPPPTTAPKSLL